MPYKRIEDAPPNIQRLDDTPLSVEQANEIAAAADAITGVDNPWAVAIANWKKGHEVKGDAWVKRSEDVEKLVEFVKEQAPWLLKWYHNTARGYAGGKAAPKDAMPWMEKVALGAMCDEDLADADDDELAHVHKRLHQLWGKLDKAAYKCMECGKPATKEALWAEGMARARLCDNCYATWSKAHKDDIVRVTDLPVEKGTPTVADVHVASFEGMGQRRKPLDIERAHKALVAELHKRKMKHLEKDDLDGIAKEMIAEIVKADSKQQKVYAVVLEPRVVDAQGDWESDEEVEKAAHSWLENFQQVGIGHKGEHRSDIVPCESYIAPTDFEMGGQTIPKGAWVLGVHVKDAGLWQKIEKSEYTGFSVQGLGKRTQKALD